MKVVIVLVFAASSVFAQLPGRWQLHPPVCTQCGMPAMFDVRGSEAVIVLRSDTVSTYYNEYFWRTYRTSDWRAKWSLAVDTVTNIALDPFHTRLGANQLHYYGDGGLSAISGAIHVYSLDTGDTWIVGYKSASSGVAIYTNNPSTIFKLSRSYKTDEPNFIEASTDSGFAYFKTQDVILGPFESLFKGSFYSKTDIWASVSPIQDTTSPGVVMHSEDAGSTWSRSLPFDSASWMRSFFSIGGLVTGANKGTLYMLGNVYHYQLPDFKMIDILYTTDNGATWLEDASNIDTLNRADSNWGFATMNLYNPSGSQLWSVFWNKHTVGYSPNNGGQWYLDSTTFKDEDIYLMLWNDSTHGYAVTYADSIVRFYEYEFPASAGHQRQQDALTIYPSIVTTGEISLESAQAVNGALVITDIMGRQVFSQDLQLDRAAPKQIQLSDFPNGVYLLTFRSGTESTSARFVKM